MSMSRRWQTDGIPLWRKLFSSNWGGMGKQILIRHLCLLQKSGQSFGAGMYFFSPL